METAATRFEPGTFLLNIEIAGLCLFRWGPGRETVRLYMPDARKPESPTAPPPRHPDGQIAVPHVGYLRFDLKNVSHDSTGVDTAKRERKDGTPSYEVVHRFEHEELQLGLPDEHKAIEGFLKVPHFGEFAPVLEVNPAVGDAVPPPFVLMRTQLSGGTFETEPDAARWKLSGELSYSHRRLVREIGGEVRWSRILAGDGITLRLVKFSGGAVEIPLKAVPDQPGAIPTIRLKIANLCENPLEWGEIAERRVNGPDDDFKWLYRLLRQRTGTDPEEFPKDSCPVPVPCLGATVDEGSLRDCFSGQIS